MKRLLKVKHVAAIVFRFLMGIMWTMSGWTWLTRDDPATYLTDSLKMALSNGQTYSFYAVFLERQVLTNSGLFATLVSLGEFLTGISIIIGTITRVGTSVAIFLLINYSLMNGSLFSPFNLLFLSIHFILLFSRAGRFYGVDKFLNRRWPESRFF